MSSFCLGMVKEVASSTNTCTAELACEKLNYFEGTVALDTVLGLQPQLPDMLTAHVRFGVLCNLFSQLARPSHTPCGFGGVIAVIGLEPNGVRPLFLKEVCWPEVIKALKVTMSGEVGSLSALLCDALRLRVKYFLNESHI